MTTICTKCYGVRGEPQREFYPPCNCPEYQQLCRSEIQEGDYDYIIKEGIKDILGSIMKASKGKSNPKQVLERIAKLTKEI